MVSVDADNTFAVCNMLVHGYCCDVPARARDVVDVEITISLHFHCSILLVTVETT